MNFTEHCEFTGYNNTEDEGHIIALFKDGKIVDELDGEGQIICDVTPFYVQSGGQVADTGVIEGDHVKAHVLDGIKTRNKQWLHNHQDSNRGSGRSQCLRIDPQISNAETLKNKSECFKVKFKTLRRCTQ